MHASIDEMIALEQFAMRMQICMIATVCFLFCTMPVLMIVGRKKERALLQHMQTCHMRGRVQFISGKVEVPVGDVVVWFECLGHDYKH
jgi:hypothetical protein